MNNPSSMFGHTLFRIDRADNPSALTAYALHFAATTSGDNGFVYVIKGLTGGYPGYFSVMPYYEKVKSYNDIEDRDIWEYRLNLTPEEIRRIVYHTWELHFFYADYYFFKENCSYNLLWLLEYARPSLNLSRQFMFWAIPADTVRAVAEADLVTDTHYRPSKSTRIKQIIAAGGNAIIPDAMDLLDQQTDPEHYTQSALPPEQKIDTLDLAFEYLHYQQLNNDYPFENGRTLALTLLRNRSTLGKRPTSRPEPPTPAVRPDQGHRAARIILGGGTYEGRGFGQLSLRPSYHDLLDPVPGFTDGSAITGAQLTLRYGPDDNQTRVQRFDLFDIYSLTPYDPVFRAISWRAGLYWDRQPGPGDSEVSGTTLAGGSGITLGASYRFYTLMEGALRNLPDTKYPSTAGLGGSAGMTGGAGIWRYHLWAKAHHFFASDDDRVEAGAGQSFALTANNALRVTWKTSAHFGHSAQELTFGYAHYF